MSKDAIYVMEALRGTSCKEELIRTLQEMILAKRAPRVVEVRPDIFDVVMEECGFDKRAVGSITYAPRTDTPDMNIRIVPGEDSIL